MLTLRPYQEEIVRAVLAAQARGRQRVLYTAPTGTGKCVTPDTLVWNRGLRTFGDLWGSTRIEGPHGPAEVSGWYDDGEREGYRVRTECGLEIDGTAGHRVWARTRQGEEGWKCLPDLDCEDWIGIARGGADFGDAMLAPDDAYLLGLAIADGCLVHANGTQWFRIDKQVPVLTAVRKTLGAWRRAAGGRSDGRVHLTEKSDYHAFLSTFAPRFSGFLAQKFGCVWSKSETRTVPSIILGGRREVIQSFLRGYFDGDGYCEEMPGISTASPILARQVQQLLLGLGIYTSIRTKPTTHLPAHVITIRDLEAFDRLVGFTRYGLRKDKAYTALLERSRNPNLDTIPGLGSLLRRSAQKIAGHTLRKDAWRYIDAYYSSEKQPGYDTLAALIPAIPPGIERTELTRILNERRGWSKVVSIEPSLARRIDCQVEEQHAFLGNGLINHNTVVFVALQQQWPVQGKTLVLAHREELLDQAARSFLRADPSLCVETEQGTRKATPAADIVVASVQTVGRPNSKRLDWLRESLALVIADESHHAPAPGHQRTFERFGCYDPGGPMLVGCTATPKRLDRQGLDRVFEEQVYAYSIRQAIADGYLCDLRGYRVQSTVDLSKVRSLAGDFNQAQLAQAVNVAARTESALKHWQEVAADRPTIVFCASVEHSKAAADAWKAAGVAAEHLDGTTDRDERKAILDRFKSGVTQVLSNVEVLCLDEETEILTDKGWTGIDQMTFDHKVANWDAGVVSFSPPLEIFRRERQPGERMVVLQTKNRSVRVTEGHRMAYRTFRKGRFKLSRSEDLVGKTCEIPISGQAYPWPIRPVQEEQLTNKQIKRRVVSSSYILRAYKGYSWEDSRDEAGRRLERRLGLRYKDPSDLTLDECRFIGLWLGDGNRTHLASGGVEHSVTFAKRYGELCEWMEALIVRLGLDHVRREGISKSVKGECPFWRWSFPRGTGFGSQERIGVYPIEPYLEKSGSDLLWGLSEPQFDALIGGLHLADGNHGESSSQPKSYRISVGNKRLADYLQAIAVCRGYRSNLLPSGPNLWCLSLRKETSHRLTKYRFEFEDEQRTERVWCVKSRTGFIVTRRRGTVTVLGNCEGFDHPPTSCIVMLRPTQSWTLYCQQAGRGTRVHPGKDSCVIIDVVDNCTKHGLATVPAILDLPPGLDLQGHTLREAAEKLEELGTRAAALQDYQPKLFSDLDTMLEQVDLLTGIEPPEEVREAGCELAWLRMPGGGYAVPCGARRTETGYGPRREARLTRDMLGTWTFAMLEGGQVVSQGQRGAHETDTEVLRLCDGLIRKRWPEVVFLAGRQAPWRKNPPSDRQVHALRRFQISPEIIAHLDRGGASALLDQCFARKRST